MFGLAEQILYTGSKDYLEPVIGALKTLNDNMDTRIKEMSALIRLFTISDYDDKTFDTKIKAYYNNFRPEYLDGRYKDSSAVINKLEDLKNNKDKIKDNIIKDLNEQLTNKTKHKFEQLSNKISEWIKIINETQKIYVKKSSDLVNALNQLSSVVNTNGKNLDTTSSVILKNCFSGTKSNNNRNWFKGKFSDDDLLPKPDLDKNTNRILISMLSTLTDSGTENIVVKNFITPYLKDIKWPS